VELDPQPFVFRATAAQRIQESTCIATDALHDHYRCARSAGRLRTFAKAERIAHARADIPIAFRHRAVARDAGGGIRKRRAVLQQRAATLRIC
jgi:hypothetical protein